MSKPRLFALLVGIRRKLDCYRGTAENDFASGRRMLRPEFRAHMVELADTLL